MSETKVRVIDAIGGECLFECSMEDVERAYQFATQMEELGLDVKIDAPSLPETLGSSLGASEDQRRLLKQELEHEIDSHNSPCGGCETPVDTPRQ